MEASHHSRAVRIGAHRSHARGYAVWCTSFLLLACATSEVHAKTVPSATRLTDPQISAAIEGALDSDGAVPVDRIHVSTEDGIVTLTGTVGNLLARDRTLRLAETIKGVRTVIDRIDVKPATALSDRVLEKDVKDALFYDPATSSDAIDAHVLNGRVTLTGSVDSFTEQELAERVAKGVNGIRSVDNQLQITYVGDRGVGEIRADILERLRWDALLDARMVTVAVDPGGAVRLSGLVGSAAEKRRAAIDAWVAGVRTVDDEKLAVDYFAYHDNRRHRALPEPDDQIESAIEEAFRVDPRLERFDLQVDSNVGEVSLRGTVDNLAAADAAAEIARATTGVAAVRNHIKTEAGPTSDARIKSWVIDAILRDPYLQPFEISVAAHDGVVSLAGDVDTYFEKLEADRVAARAVGVWKVQNGLVVAHPNQPLTYDARIAGAYPYAYDWYDYRTFRTYVPDRRLEDQIEDQLWWSPYVDSADVQVRVHEGVATLAGKVASYAAMNAAVADAYRGGATWVDNELKVAR